jgi:hypothetical protein
VQPWKINQPSPRHDQQTNQRDQTNNNNNKKKQPPLFPSSSISIQDRVTASEAEAALLEYGIGDVTKPETLSNAIAGASAVVFASSASRKGGNAEAVDFKGMENIARCARVCVCLVVVFGVGVVWNWWCFGLVM